MSGSKKFWVAFGLTFLLFLAAYGVASLTFIPRFEELEKGYVEEKLHFLGEYVEGRLQDLEKITGDWAAWDDTYDFVENLNKDYVTANLVEETLSNLGLEYILLLDVEGRAVHAVRLGPGGMETIQAGEMIDKALSIPALYRFPGPGQGTAGFLVLGTEIFMAAARPIVKSDLSGPVRGGLVMVRRLGPGLLDEIGHAGETKIAAAVTGHAPPPDGRGRGFSDSLEEGKGSYLGRVLFPRLDGGGVVFSTVMHPGIQDEANRALSLFTLLLAGLFLFWFAAVWFCLDRNLFQRLGAIAQKAGSVSFFEKTNGEEKNQLLFLERSLDGIIGKLEEYIEKLRKRDEELYNALKNLPIGVFMVDQESRTVSWANPVLIASL